MSEPTKEDLTARIVIAAQSLANIRDQLYEKETAELKRLEEIYLEILCQNARMLPKQPGERKLKSEVSRIYANHPLRPDPD